MLNKNDKINLNDLRKLYKGKIKNISKFNKSDLILKINEYLSILLIQRSYRIHFYKNAEDCITMDKVNYPCFIYKTKFGKHHFYNYDSIIKYIMKSGDTRDPLTRTAYSDIDLTRLDSEVKKYFPKIKYKSTLKIKKNPNYAKRIRNRENEILAFQLRLDELKNCLFFIINSGLINLPNEPILADTIEYNSVSIYIISILYEFKLILTNLNVLDTYQANFLKNEFIADLENFDLDENIYEIIENIKKIEI